MAREITAGVLLSLKDQFSSKIQGAGVSAKGFADKAAGAAQKVNDAFSGLAGTLATLGVSLGALGLAKASIDYEDAMIRIGANAGMTARETNQLRRELLAAATDAKIPLQEMQAYAAALAENSIGYDVISESAPFAARAIQGLGISGKEAADLLSVLVNRGADVDTFKEKLNNLAEIDDRLQGMGIAEFTRYLPQLMEQGEVSVDNIENLCLAILTLNNGANNTKAIAQYTSAMRDFAGSGVREKLRKFFNFDTKENGELKSFVEIMEFVTARANELGDYEGLGKVLGFSESTILAMKQYNNHYQETIDKVGELGDTADAVSSRAERNAGSLKSALTGLQDAVLAQADDALTKPIETLANLLNEHPDGLEKAIKGVGIAIAGLGALKLGAGIVSFIANLKSLQSGGGKNLVEGLSNAGGGAGIPVHVTNWSGGLPGPGGGQPGGISLLDQYGNPLTPGTGNGGPAAGSSTPAQPSLPGNRTPLESARNAVNNITGEQYASGAAGAGIMAAFVKIPQMIDELHTIDQDETLTDHERGEAKGGAIGDATGSIIGAAAGGAAGIAAGAAVGAAVGSVVPVLGTAVGALVGAGIGALGMWLGGKAGRAVGEAIGGAVAGDDADAAQSPEAAYYGSMAAAAPQRPGISQTTRTGNDAAYNYGRYSGFQKPVNDLIVTPQGQFSAHPDDYIFAMKNPAALANEVRSVERVPQAIPPVAVNGEIELRSELFIDDKGYRLRQRVEKNTTPYKFTVGSAQGARLIQ